MTSGKKIALSLLISIIAFSTFMVVSFTGLFNLIEIKFYQPRVIKSIENNISTITQYHTEYTSSLIERFANYANEKDVQSFLEKEVSSAVQKSRLQLTGSLVTETTGLLGLRVMDNTGRHIHYSTFTKNGQDLKNQNSKQLSYLDYGKSPSQPYSSINYNEIKAEENQQYKITYYVKKDENGKKVENCIIYTVPFFDENAIRKGSVLFYCDNSGFNRYLLSKNLVSFNGTSASFANDDSSAGGIVFGLTDIPLINTNILEEKILSLWQADSPLDVKDIEIEDLAENNYKKLHLFTKKTESNTLVSFIFDDSYLEMADEAKILLLAVVFITLFLTIFLLLNLKHDDMTVIRDRIKRFQLAFITEYIDKKDSGQLTSLPQGLSERRNELTAEIKKSLGKRGKKHSAEVEKLLESSWNEILTALGVKTVSPLLANKAVIDSDELRAILEDILGSGKLKINAAAIETPVAVQTVKTPAAPVSKPAEPEELDEVEEIEEVSEAEELDDIEEIEEVTEAEELDDVEEIEEVTEAEELDEVEEIEEVTEAEELDDVEEIEEVTEPEELDEVEEIEEVTEAEELYEVEEIEEVTEAEELDDVEEIEDVSETEELDDVEEIEEVSEAEELDEVEEIEEVSETEELDDVEEIEEVTEAEELDDVEEIEEVTEAEELDEVEEIEEVPETEELDEVEDEIQKLADDVSTKIDAELDDLMIEEMIFSSPARTKNMVVEELQEIANFNTQSMDFSFLDEEDDFDSQTEPDPILPEEITPEEPDYSAVENTEPDAENINPEEFSIQDFEPIPEESEESFDSELEETADENEINTILPSEIEEETNSNETEELSESIEEAVGSEEVFAEPIEETIGSEEKIVETIDEADDAEEVQPLQSEKDSHPFLFTAFAANNNNITDLQTERKDAIIEEEDGTFSIEYNEEETSAIELDDVFKKLVDSVLK